MLGGEIPNWIPILLWACLFLAIIIILLVVFAFNDEEEGMTNINKKVISTKYKN